MKSRRGFAASGLASQAGKKGSATLVRERGHEHFVALGKKGGAALKATRGPDYFKEIGKKGLEKRWGQRNGSEPGVDGQGGRS